MSDSIRDIVRQINNIHIHETVIIRANLYWDYLYTVPVDSFQNKVSISEYALSVKKWLDENVKNDYCFAGRPQHEYCTLTGKYQYHYPRIYFRHESDLLAARLCWGGSV